MTALAELRDSQDLLVNLTLREVRGKYKRTVFGQLWSLLNPIAQMATYSVVFSLVLRNHPDAGAPSGLDVFALWLAAGLLPWLFFSNVLTTGMASLVSNANLIQKVYFPRETLVIANTFSWLFTFAIEMAVVAVAIVGYEVIQDGSSALRHSPLLYLPVTILLMVLLAALGLGLALMLSVANVYFRDTQHFIGIAMQVWFYATPIVYPLKLVSEKHPDLAFVLRLNPLERFVEAFRNTLYDGRLPTWQNSLVLLVISLGTLALGYALFKRYEGRLAEEL